MQSYSNLNVILKVFDLFKFILTTCNAKSKIETFQSMELIDGQNDKGKE